MQGHKKDHTGKHQAQSKGEGEATEGERKMWASAFLVVSMGKIGQGRVIKLRAGQFE